MRHMKRTQTCENNKNRAADRRSVRKCFFNKLWFWPAGFSAFLCLSCRKRREWSRRWFGDGGSDHQRTLRRNGDWQRSRWHGVFWRGAGKPGAEATSPPPHPSVWAGTPGQFPRRKTGCRPQTAESEEPTGDQHQGEGEPETVQPTGLERETDGGQEDADWRECLSRWRHF